MWQNQHKEIPLLVKQDKYCVSISNLSVFFKTELPDCRRLNKFNRSFSSSVSRGGCNDADLVELHFGTVTGNSDIDDDGVESTDFKPFFRNFSFSIEEPKESQCSTTSISDAPLPVASGILFRGLIDDEE